MNKTFSFRRGFLFFGKANIVLLAMIGLLLLNKGSWTDDAQKFFTLFITLSEAMIVLLSIVSCLPQRNK